MIEPILKIKENRLKKNMTQNELAEIARITQQEVSMYENNHRQPSLTTAKKIANALELTLDELIEFKEIQLEYSKELVEKGTKK